MIHSSRYRFETRLNSGVRRTRAKDRMLKVCRVLGIVLGGFLVANLVLNVFGIIPNSETPLPLNASFADSIPLAAGAALLIPYQRVRRRRARFVIGLVLGLLTLFILVISIEGVAGYLSGTKSWQVLPVVGFISVVSLGNLWAFFILSNHSAQTYRSGA